MNNILWFDKYNIPCQIQEGWLINQPSTGYWIPGRLVGMWIDGFQIYGMFLDDKTSGMFCDIPSRAFSIPTNHKFQIFDCEDHLFQENTIIAPRTWPTKVNVSMENDDYIMSATLVGTIESSANELHHVVENNRRIYIVPNNKVLFDNNKCELPLHWKKTRY